MPTSYYTNTAKGGSTNISSNVFSQIAYDSLVEGANKDYVNDISLTLPRGKKNVKVEIVTNKVSIKVFVSAYKEGNANKALQALQQKIYDDIYEATEISNVKVDLSVLTFVDKK